jgi:hypothetical protein
LPANLGENRGKDRGQKQGAEIRGRDKGQRQWIEKIDYYILLTSPIIAYQISIFTSSIKPDRNFLGLFIFIIIAFYSPITEVLAFPKPRLWYNFHF